MSLQQKGHKGNQFQETTWITSCCENTIEATKISGLFFFFRVTLQNILMMKKVRGCGAVLAAAFILDVCENKVGKQLKMTRKQPTQRDPQSRLDESY